MRFTIDNVKQLKEAIEKIQGKGKYQKESGLSSGKLLDYFYCELNGNTLSLWNGNSTFVLCHTLEVNGEEDGNFFGSATRILPYLKKFTELNVTVNDFIHMSGNGRTASIPKVVNHPNSDALERIKDMISHVEFSANVDRTYTFGKSNFEGVFQTTGGAFDDAISFLELSGVGIYKLNFDGEECTMSTSSGIQQSTTPLETTQVFGEPATLEYSSPVHKFFDKDELINFYVKDEFPLLVISANKKALKAPYSGGN